MQITLTRPEAVYLRSTLHHLLGQADANPGSIGHLGMRAPVAEMLEALESDPTRLSFTRNQADAMLFIFNPETTWENVREDDPLSELIPVIRDDIGAKFQQALETDPPEED